MRYGQRVERLVLACTSSGGAGGASFPLHELTHLAPEEYARRNIRISDTRHDAAWQAAYQAAHPAEFQALLDQALAGQQIGAPPGGGDEPGRQIGARRQLEARIGHDTCDRLPSLRLPVYICGGRYDGIAPPANLAAMQAAYRGHGWSCANAGMSSPSAFG